MYTSNYRRGGTPRYGGLFTVIFSGGKYLWVLVDFLSNQKHPVFRKGGNT
jgi:hypothetical protein